MLTPRLYVSYAADLVAVLLMLGLSIRLRSLPVERKSLKQHFLRFSWVVFLMSLLHLLQSSADLEYGGFTTEDYGSLFESENMIWLCILIVAMLADIFLSTVFIYMWIRFMCLHLFGDIEFLRRKFWAGFTPLALGAVLTCVTIPMALMSELGYWIYIGALILFFAIRIFYFLVGFWLLREYKRQNGYLRFFNPWVFFAPVFAGWLLQDLFSWGLSALGSTLGLLLIYSSIVSEQRYMIPETGLYNMEFIQYLKELIRKKRYEPLSAMRFTLTDSREMKAFAALLRKVLPDNCEPIVHSDREIVVLTSVQERGPLALVLEDVRSASEVSAEIILKNNQESSEEFLDRVL